jgi:hypothetical protein
MGHRLLAFLGQALPLHPEYHKASAAAFRAQAVLDLEWIQDKMQDLALKIDEEQLNVFITMDFDPQPEEDDSTISSLENNHFKKFADFATHHDSEGWEDFTDWAFPSSDAPTASMTTNASGDDVSTPGGPSSSSSSSSSSGSEQQEKFPDPFDDPEIVFELEEDSTTSEEEDDDEDSEEVTAPPRPQAIVKFHDDEDSEGSSHDHGYDLNDIRTASSFLKKIAKEDVRYETDSEAVDSWAQDGDTGSRASSGGTLPTYDPARIAFREIMNKAPKLTLSSSPTTACIHPPSVPPNSPCSTSGDNNEEKSGDVSDEWAAFDFASIRQTNVI